MAQYAVYIFWKYSNNITLIEEWNLFGSGKSFQIVSNYYNYNLLANFNEVHYYLIPESIIDLVLSLLVGDISLFWQLKLIYRMFFLVLPLVILFTYFRFSLVTHFALPVLLVSTQSLTRINWDLGSLYSIILFVVLLILTFVKIRSNRYFIFATALFFTLPATINPPSFFAALLCYFFIVTVTKVRNIIKIHNIKIIYVLITIHVAILLSFWILNVNKLNQNIDFFSKLTPSQPNVEKILLYIQGLGLWWGDQGYENGTPYYTSWNALLQQDLVVTRFVLIALIFLIVLSNFIRFKDTRNYSLDFEFIIILLTSLIFIFILSSNIFNLWKYLNDFSVYFKIFRDPDRKFLQLYSLVAFLILGFSLKIVSNFTKKIVHLVLLILVSLSLLKLYNYEDRYRDEFYPNPSKILMRDLQRDLGSAKFKLKKESPLCLLESGVPSIDYLVRNVMISHDGGNIFSNFGSNSSILPCSNDINSYILIIPPYTYIADDLLRVHNISSCSIEKFTLFYTLNNCAVFRTSNQILETSDPFYRSYVSNADSAFQFKIKSYDFQQKSLVNFP